MESFLSRLIVTSFFEFFCLQVGLSHQKSWHSETFFHALNLNHVPVMIILKGINGFNNWDVLISIFDIFIGTCTGIDRMQKMSQEYDQEIEVVNRERKFHQVRPLFIISVMS